MNLQSLMRIGKFLTEQGLDKSLDDAGVTALIDGVSKMFALRDLRLVDITAETVADLSAGSMDSGTCETVAEALRAFADGSELKLANLVSSGQWVNLLAGRTVKESERETQVVTRRCPSCGELLFS